MILLASAVMLTSGVGEVTTNINQNNGNGVVEAKRRRKKRHKVWNTGIHFYKKTVYKNVYNGGMQTYHFKTKYNKHKKLVSIKRTSSGDYDAVTQWADVDGYRYYHGKKYYVCDGSDSDNNLYKNSKSKKEYSKHPQQYDNAVSFFLASDFSKKKNKKPIVYTAKDFIPVYWLDSKNVLSDEPDGYIGKNRTFLLMQSTGVYDKSFKLDGDTYVAAAYGRADQWEKDKFGYWWIDASTQTVKRLSQGIDPDEYLYPEDFDSKVKKKMKAIDLSRVISWAVDGASYIKKSDLQKKAVRGGHFETGDLDLRNK